MEGFRAEKAQGQIPAAFWRVDSRAVRPSAETWEETGDQEEPGSGQNLKRGEESSGLRATLEAKWNIHRGGCLPGWRWGRKLRGREAEKVVGDGGA